MNIGEHLLAALASYGLPLLFGVMAAGCVGLPVPLAVLLIAGGTFIQDGEWSLPQVIFIATAGAVLGDMAGYVIGRWGGDAAIAKLHAGDRARARLAHAEAFARQWGAGGVFFTRWLLTPLGPWVNIVSGLIRYPWPRFLLWDVIGELLWVVIYVLLGRFIAGRAQAVSALAGDVTWVIVALAAALLAASMLWRAREHAR